MNDEEELGKSWGVIRAKARRILDLDILLGRFYLTSSHMGEATIYPL
jgi:hypothetical protein